MATLKAGSTLASSPTVSDNSTKIATTEFVKGNNSVNGKFGIGGQVDSEAWGSPYAYPFKISPLCALAGDDTGTSSSNALIFSNLYYDGATFRFLNSVSSKYGGYLRITGNGILSASVSTSGGLKDAAATMTDFFTVQVGSAMITDSSVYPKTDNARTLGASSLRWSVVYSATGSINTSDERDKVFYSTEASEKAAALEIKSIIKKFKFKDAIAEKGEGNARIHYGVGAQSVVSILQKHGLNPFEYAFVCYDKWDALKEVKDETGVITQQAREAGDKYGIRYEELAMFILGAI